MGNCQKQRNFKTIKEDFKVLYIKYEGCLAKAAKELNITWMTAQRYEKKFFPDGVKAKQIKRKNKNLSEQEVKIKMHEKESDAPVSVANCEYLNKIYNICHSLVIKRSHLYERAKPSGIEVATVLKIGLDAKKAELELKKMEFENKKLELETEKLRYEMRMKNLGFEENKEEVVVYNLPVLQQDKQKPA